MDNSVLFFKKSDKKKLSLSFIRWNIQTMVKKNAVIHTTMGSLLTTITATTGARKTQINWSSVESQHLMGREEEIDSLCWDIILGYGKFLVWNHWIPSLGNRRLKKSILIKERFFWIVGTACKWHTYILLVPYPVGCTEAATPTITTGTPANRWNLSVLNLVCLILVSFKTLWLNIMRLLLNVCWRHYLQKDSVSPLLIIWPRLKIAISNLVVSNS